MKKIIFIGIAAFAGFLGNAQQTATFAQYAFNQLAINPGYAGSQGLLSASVITRFQNIGLDGAPQTKTFSIHSPLWDKSLAGGALIIRDGVGVINQTGVHAIGAYRIFFDEEKDHYLSFGMQLGMITYAADYANLLSFQPDDPFFGENVRQSKPNIGAGVFYRNEMYYAGISMPHMMNNVFDRGPDFTTIRQSTPFLVHGGYVFILSKILKFKPNFLFKVIDGQTFELDINGSIQLDELLWVGLSYKLPRGINLLTEFKLTDQMLLGYAYTINRGNLRSENLGTHEILLNYRFNFRKYRMVSPRYF